MVPKDFRKPQCVSAGWVTLVSKSNLDEKVVYIDLFYTPTLHRGGDLRSSKMTICCYWFYLFTDMNFITVQISRGESVNNYMKLEKSSVIT